MNLLKGRLLTLKQWLVSLCVADIPSTVSSDASVSPDVHDNGQHEDAEHCAHTRTHTCDMCVIRA